MDRPLLLRNRSVCRVLVGVPEGHAHIRARIETAAGDVITLQEATLAALCRAYMDVSTHPQRRAVALETAEIDDGKEGFARHQLLEVAVDEGQLRRELAAPPPESANEAPIDSGPSPMGPDGTTADQDIAAPDDPTSPHKRDEILTQDVLKTEHGQPQDDDEDDIDLEDELEEIDDGPVFGDVPTHHSKPKKPVTTSKRKRSSGGKKKSPAKKK